MDSSLHSVWLVLFFLKPSDELLLSKLARSLAFLFAFLRCLIVILARRLVLVINVCWLLERIAAFFNCCNKSSDGNAADVERSEDQKDCHDGSQSLRSP